MIGTSYHKMNRLDSAQFYLEQASSSTQLYTRAGANHALSALYKQQKEYALSEQYLSEYVDCRDSIEAIYNAPKMKELEVRYSKEKAEHEKDRLLQDQKNMQLLLILSFILGASVFLVGCLLYQRRIRLKDQELYEAKDIAHYYEDKYIESIKEIERKKNQIDQWNAEVQEKECLLKQNMFQLDRLQENKIQLEEQIENSKRDSDSHKAELMEKELLLKSGEEELKLLQEEKNRLEREILNSSDLYKAYDALKGEVQARNKDVEQLKADTSELTKSNHSLMTFVLKDSEIQKRLNEGGEPHLTPELWLTQLSQISPIILVLQLFGYPVFKFGYYKFSFS